MPMKTVPQALNIRSLMLQNIEKADITDDPEERRSLLNFVIAGAGPTGVELAGALAEFRKSILKNDYPFNRNQRYAGPPGGREQPGTFTHE